MKRSAKEGKGRNAPGKKEDQCRVKEMNGWIKDQSCERKLESGKVQST
jgi:hypothetical protein